MFPRPRHPPLPLCLSACLLPPAPAPPAHSRSQLYIAALNVLIGIARAPHLDVRAVVRAPARRSAPPHATERSCRRCIHGVACRLPRHPSLRRAHKPTPFLSPRPSCPALQTYHGISNEWLDWLRELQAAEEAEEAC